VEPDITGQTSYQWYVFNPITMVFDILPGETGSSIIITQSGTYQVEATISGNCASTDEIVIEFAPQPIAVVPDDLIGCDELPNDGFAEFDLTLRDAQIINGQPNTFVSYFTTLAAAQSGGFPIPTPGAFTNTSIGFQTVYARLQEITFGCFDVVPLDDGVEVFDLTSKDAEILNILVNVVLTYHLTQIDAEMGVGAIVAPDVYPSGNAIIWVR
jgi:hypothetical protein